jgi:hypothetical protein
MYLQVALEAWVPLTGMQLIICFPGAAADDSRGTIDQLIFLSIPSTSKVMGTERAFVWTGYPFPRLIRTFDIPEGQS